MNIKNSGYSVDPLQIENNDNIVDLLTRTAKSEDSMIVETINNAVEDPANASLIYCTKADPNLFGDDLAFFEYNKVKLAIWNNGNGMTKQTLEEVTNLSKSVGKDQGKNGSFGIGAKISSLKVNESGLMWISCTKGKVHRVLLRKGPEGQYGRVNFALEDADGNIAGTRVVDITDTIKANIKNGSLIDEYFNTEKDYTIIVFCGNDSKQNTVKSPYGQEIADGWMVKELSRRYATIPSGAIIKFDRCLRNKNQMRSKFTPILDVIEEGNQHHQFKYEVINVNQRTGKVKSLGDAKTIPAYVNAGEINIIYAHDPDAERGDSSGCWSNHITRQGITKPYSGIIWKTRQDSVNQIWDYSGPLLNGYNTWTTIAPRLGILHGYNEFRVFVQVHHKDYENNFDRTKLVKPYGTETGDVKEITLDYFSNEVRNNIPEWMHEIMKQNNKSIMDVSDLADKLTLLLKEWRAQVNARKVVGTNAGKGQKPMPEGIDFSIDHLTCPRCADDGVEIVMLKGTQTCHVCGYKRKKPGQTTSRVFDPNGSLKMVRKFPQIEYVPAEGHGLPLHEKFKYMAGQYADDQLPQILYVNEDYSSTLAEEMKKDIGVELTAEQEALVDDYARQYIVGKCLGMGMVQVFAKMKSTGFDDKKQIESFLSPEQLSIYADAWLNGNWRTDKEYVNGIRRVLKSANKSNVDISLELV